MANERGTAETGSVAAAEEWVRYGEGSDVRVMEAVDRWNALGGTPEKGADRSLDGAGPSATDADERDGGGSVRAGSASSVGAVPVLGVTASVPDRMRSLEERRLTIDREFLSRPRPQPCEAPAVFPAEEELMETRSPRGSLPDPGLRSRIFTPNAAAPLPPPTTTEMTGAPPHHHSLAAAAAANAAAADAAIQRLCR